MAITTAIRRPYLPPAAARRGPPGGFGVVPAVGRVAGMRVAMLTGGGDCPGLNAVMRAVVRKGHKVYGDELVGLRDGWRGAIEGDVVELTVDSFRGTLPRGGTIIGSSRTNPYKVEGGPEAVKATLA